MPTYTFACPTCGEVFERRLSFHDDLSAVRCSQGHSGVHRVYQAPAIVFKGNGFYITDHGRSNGRRNGSSSNGSGESKAETKGEKATASTENKN